MIAVQRVVARSRPRLPALAAALVLALIGLSVAIILFDRAGEAGNTRTITIRYSLFSEDLIEVRAGSPVTFDLRNEDPILHEWIVGTEDVHERHRTGTEPYHDEVPTEVSLPAYETRLTTVTFDQPGEYLFVCHLPGHEAYGMKGTVRVLP